MASVGELEQVVLAMDWTPNTNHVGFYVAQALGYYSEAGISVQLLSPHLDSYETTPASRVASQTATFALAPPETVISYHLPPERPKLVAVATLLQEDLSAIVTLKSSGISRPKGLDGKVYASYAARFEGRIVQRLIQADGGKGDYVEEVPEKLGIWNTLVSGNADTTWVFKGWEGVEATMKGLELNEFTLADYGIPYLPAPVLVAHPDTLRDKADVVRKFLKASAKGFAFAAQNPSQAAKLFTEIATKENPALPTPLDAPMVLKSLQFMSPHFLDSKGSWGASSPEKWAKYIDWLSKEGLLSSFIQSRNPEPGVSVSLDELRQGNIGETFTSSKLPVGELISNSYL
ncbi:unnamed protein product [Calypogeia fissa]